MKECGGVLFQQLVKGDCCETKRCSFFTILLSFNAFAAKEIILKDGSRIRGDVQSMQNGMYQVRTDSMGTIQLNSGQRRPQYRFPIGSQAPGGSAGSGSASAPGSSSTKSAIDSIKSNIVRSPGLMSTIMELQNDPQMQAVLADPEVMRAVQNFNLQALSSNPKIKALMKNAKIRRINNAVK